MQSDLPEMFRQFISLSKMLLKCWFDLYYLINRNEMCRWTDRQTLPTLTMWEFHTSKIVKKLYAVEKNIQKKSRIYS